MSGLISGMTKGAMTLGKTAITHATKKAQGSVIFLHGSCDTGEGMRSWVMDVHGAQYEFSHYNVLYPSAPLRPYTLLNGQITGIWFDRLALGPSQPEDILSIDESARSLTNLILAHSMTSGIPLEKMVVGGFSMGGSMALHLGYRFLRNLGGIFTLSSFIPPDSKLFTDLKEMKSSGGGGASWKTPKDNSFTPEINVPPPGKRSPPPSPSAIDKILRDIEESYKEKDSSDNTPQLPPLFMAHGSKDPLTSYNWGKQTFHSLRAHGVQGHFYTFPKQTHEISRTQLRILHGWIQHVLDDPPPPREPMSEPKPRKDNINDDPSFPL